MKTAIIHCSSVVSLNRLASEMNKCMTTKQLAEVLGVDVRTVNNAVERLLGSTFQKSEIKVVSKGGRPTKVFTEKQATIIKQEIQKHHNLASRQIDNVSTEIEENQLIENAMLILRKRAVEFQRRAELAEKKAGDLQIELDKSKEYYTVKRMEKLNPDKKFNWRLLKSESEKLHKPAKDVFDSNYGTVKAYHIDVWESLYFDTLNFD